MCMTCGCGEFNNKQGDQRNITVDDLDHAAEAAGISREEACQNMESSLRQMSASMPGQMNQGQRSPEMRS